MNIKKIAAAAALCATAFGAQAMTDATDNELSSVSARDGVSIFANLKVSVGSFTYTDTDATGGSVSFNNIAVSGPMAFGIDIINGATLLGALQPVLAPTQSAAQVAALNAFLPGSGAVLAQQAAPSTLTNAVLISMPDVNINHGLDVSVGGITMGNSAASFGSVALSDIRMGGTNVYIWAH